MKATFSLSLIVLAASGIIAQQPVFRAGVDVARIDVSVMNGITPVGGLTAENFEVIDNGVPQKLDSVSLDLVPLSLTLLLDTSGSLEAERLRQLITAANGLVQTLRLDDAAALMTFSEPVRLAAPMSKARGPLLAALKNLSVGGATSLHDALFLSLQLRPVESSETRPVLLLFSDGRDSTSWLDSDQILEIARRASLLIHIVELTNNGRPTLFSERLAKAGGGRSWMASDPRDLRELFGKVLNELRSRYLLTYYPSVNKPGWHNVKVSLKHARGDVTAREGYFVQSK